MGRPNFIRELIAESLYFNKYMYASKKHQFQCDVHTMWTDAMSKHQSKPLERLS
jgi:hypothetical protein